MWGSLYQWLVAVFLIIGAANVVYFYFKWRYPDSVRTVQGRVYFALDRALGLDSETFSLESNIGSGDQRSGLSTYGKLRIRYLMWRRGISFDEARFMYVQEMFATNEIGPDGMPRDPKALVLL